MMGQSRRQEPRRGADPGGEAMGETPEIRVTACNAGSTEPRGEYVLYWMIAHRRASWNFGLQRAVEWARRFERPLVVVEGLRCGYRWASDRLHRFILDGMRDNAEAFAKTATLYYPYVEPQADAGKGMLAALAARACVVVTDDFPAFMLPRMVAAAAAQVKVLLERVDSNGLLPMRAAEIVYPTAYAFRRFLQKHLGAHLDRPPKRDPFRGVELPRLKTLPAEVTRRWPRATAETLAGTPEMLAKLPIDHSVAIAGTAGGGRAAEKALKRFLDERLERYGEERNEPEAEVTSALSPYLHFGYLSVHQVMDAIARRHEWTTEKLAKTTTGQKEGWWGLPESVEGFLDEIVTWRELGYNMCWQREDYDRYESLPEWARRTLEKHAADARPKCYTLEQFEQGRTHDPLWNAAQMQLVREGRIHNYLRMLWGKKILEWSASPREALGVLIELNNKYALDGRNPNSYSGIFWCLGRYDRPWFPERPIFGNVRYMSSENTARKVSVKNYIRRYSPDAGNGSTRGLGLLID